MSTLKGNLSSLKAKLANISSALDEKNLSKAVKEQKLKSLDERVYELLDNSPIINLNVGGKLFQTKKSNLMKDPESIFYALLSESDTSELFFDRNPRLFQEILNYLRYGKINYKKFTKTDIEFIYKEAEYYEITDIREYLGERAKSIEVKAVTTSGNYSHEGKMIGESGFSFLNEIELKRGICVGTKDMAWINFELNSLWNFDEINIGSYHGDNKNWYPGNGAGAQIQVSDDGFTFKKVGNIPFKFINKEIVNIRLDSVISAKYVRIVNNGFLGISHFLIEKDEELNK